MMLTLAKFDEEVEQRKEAKAKERQDRLDAMERREYNIYIRLKEKFEV